MKLSTSDTSYEDRQLLDELGIESIFQDQEFDSEKNVFYMHKTMVALEESNRLRDYTIMSINAVNYTKSVLEKVSQEHRLGLDINTIAYEGKVRDFIDKSIKVIQTSMKKLIEAVVIFIKNIQNAVKSALQKNQVKWYSKNRVSATIALADQSNQAKIQTDFFFSENSSANNNSLGPKLNDCASKLRYTYDQELSLSKIKAEQLLIKYIDHIREIIKDYTNKNYVDHSAEFEEIYNTVMNQGNTGSPKDKALLDRQYIQDKLYGTDKSKKKEVLVNRLVTQGDLDNLATPSNDFIKSLNDIASKMTKDLKDTNDGMVGKKLSELRDIYNQLIEKAEENGAFNNDYVKNGFRAMFERIFQRVVRVIISDVQKQYSQVFQAKVYLFSNYFKYRSLIFTAAQRLISFQS